MEQCNKLQCCPLSSQEKIAVSSEEKNPLFKEGGGDVSVFCLFCLFIGLITDLLLLSLNLIGENVNCVFSLLLTVEGGACCDPN